jgi:hypothetical protein
MQFCRGTHIRSGLGAKLQRTDDHASADGKNRFGFQGVLAAGDPGHHAEGFPQAMVKITAEHDMLTCAQHGGKGDIEIVMLNGHIRGCAAVLEKMDMLHFFHNAGHIVNVPDFAAAHLVAIQIQNLHRGAPGSGIDAVFAQLQIVPSVPTVQRKLTRSLSHHLIDQLPREINPPCGLIHPAAGMLYQSKHIILTALVGHADLFQQAQGLTVNQFHLFRAERFVNAACQSTAVHFISLASLTK